MFTDETNRINKIIKIGANTALTNKEFLEKEIEKFKASPERRAMITGEAYYFGKHDILNRKRMAIGENGELTEVKNLPNNKIVDNQYSKMIDQKNNYLLSKPITFESDNKEYAKALKEVFNRKFLRILKNLGEDCHNCGIGWLYVYYDDNSKIAFKKFKSHEILPFWKDEAHTELDLVVRVYEIEVYEGSEEKTVEKVEVYGKEGIERYVLDGRRLIPDVENESEPYITYNDNPLTWDKIPIIAFKQNNKEIPLINKVKGLQDALNTVRSDFMNNMQEDARNTIIVIKNYDGTNLGEFRRNLSTYGAVKVKTVENGDGDVKTLQVEVNSQNYIVLCDMLKKAIIENARGYDAKDERMSNNPNQMNIQSMYSDIDLDANGMETEFQASFEELMWFVNAYLENTGKGSFDGEEVKIVFNRDVLINETEAINNCKSSIGILSDESIIEQHPWVVNSDEEYKKLLKQQEKENLQPDNSYGNDLNHNNKVGDSNE